MRSTHSEEHKAPIESALCVAACFVSQGSQELLILTPGNRGGGDVMYGGRNPRQPSPAAPAAAGAESESKGSSQGGSKSKSSFNTSTGAFPGFSEL